jgi:hypothetical protein
VRTVAWVIAIWLAAIATICGQGDAFGQIEELTAAPADQVLLFSGIDFWRSGGFVHGGMLWSPDGLASEGFTLKLLVGAGSYRFQSGMLQPTGQVALASVMPGWRFKGDGFEITAFAGLDVEEHSLPADSTDPLRGLHFGMRAGVDVWYEPASAMMMAASLWFSSAGLDFWTRGAVGGRVFDWAWVGPEVTALGNPTYQQYRVGAHVTSFMTGALEWSSSVGYAYDSDGHAGPYARIGVLTRQ